MTMTIEQITAAYPNVAKLEEAAHEEIMCRECCDTSDKWQDEASPEAVLALIGMVKALVAENAGLKSFGDKLNEMHQGLDGTGTGIQGGYEVACQQLGLEAAMEEFDAIETPATDSFIADVKAQVWMEAKDFTKSMLACDSVDHIDFLFDGKVQQLRGEEKA
jgi:hypothetical protein